MDHVRSVACSERPTRRGQLEEPPRQRLHNASFPLFLMWSLKQKGSDCCPKHPFHIAPPARIKIFFTARFAAGQLLFTYNSLPETKTKTMNKSKTKTRTMTVQKQNLLKFFSIDTAHGHMTPESKFTFLILKKGGWFSARTSPSRPTLSADARQTDAVPVRASA